MKKFFPLLLALAVGLGGYLYFNQKILESSKVQSVFVYDREKYNTKKPSPLIKLEESKLIDIVVETINSSEITNREISVAESDYILDIISRDKKETFFLWLNEDATRGMYQNKNSKDFYIITHDDTNRLKTLLFR